VKGVPDPALLSLCLRLGTVLIALITLIPLFFVIVYTIATGWEESYRLLVRPIVGVLLGKSSCSKALERSPGCPAGHPFLRQ
jgi:hypothetical protein